MRIFLFFTCVILLHPLSQLFLPPPVRGPAGPCGIGSCVHAPNRQTPGRSCAPTRYVHAVYALLTSKKGGHKLVEDFECDRRPRCSRVQHQDDATLSEEPGSTASWLLIPDGQRWEDYVNGGGYRFFLLQVRPCECDSRRDVPPLTHALPTRIRSLHDSPHTATGPQQLRQPLPLRQWI